MYHSIHVTAGYSHFKINSDGPIGVSKKNQGVIDALLKLGNRFTAPFGGFIEAENVVGLKWVKLVDIKYLCTDEEAETIEYVIQKDHYVVGTYQDRKLYILLFGGEPKHHQIKGLEQDGKNNVFGLF
ncbi:hypothetical protein VCRA2119O147_480031 [Vibrio crassostreae]|uniref:hypothetical protein n=1 Tax=Vibrio TaxID=662 RepID=UPI0002E90337|nr:MULTISPECIES: hypothetical protein [Vibrio]OEF78879.1 hypothetical protein A162_15905 [Vibrio tasmaniensis 1F-155]OMO28724.1 hypothetical protein BH583_01170 [Vibrio lentus]PME51369.1 hypothetical protein BCV35_06400 [Vibrio cyclitrophicus]PMF14363.1 hypothetical protein BCV20_10405 [Vibrio cyclitrophicus]PMI68264.1 hypothetical protein BCU39_12775 [Vibrio cyclitrophicus]